MELSFKDLDLKEVEKVIKSVDFDSFLKGIFYIGNEIEQIHNELKNISNALHLIDKSIFEIAYPSDDGSID